MQENARLENAYDPETIELLRNALDQAWNSLSPASQSITTKSSLAVKILRSAADGERDPKRLRAAATVALIRS